MYNEDVNSYWIDYENLAYTFYKRSDDVYYFDVYDYEDDDDFIVSGHFTFAEVIDQSAITQRQLKTHQNISELYPAEMTRLIIDHQLSHPRHTSRQKCF